jgi:hypothetical protein
MIFKGTVYACVLNEKILDSFVNKWHIEPTYVPEKLEKNL